MAFLIIFVIISVGVVAQPIRFTYPIEGVLGQDYFIVNHVDHDSRTAVYRDHACGIQTYDGHDGTDFILRSFRHMDSGIYVLAAADGEVITAVDSLPDRNKQSVIESGFGNFIAIRHPEGYITYYAHLRRGSVRVKVGDVVRGASRIAFVGSSGNSSDPHVHFEVWKRMDPFSGACADDVSMWGDQPEYVTEYTLIDADVTTWPPILDTLRERPPHADVKTTDSTITFWSLQQGIAATDALEVEWLTPDGTSWFRYEMSAGVTSHYFYWWSYILRPAEGGVWTAIQRINGIERARVKFNVSAVTSVHPIDTAEAPSVTIRENIVTTSPTSTSIAVYSLDGRLLSTSADGTLVLPRVSLGMLRAIFQGGRMVTMLFR